MKNRKNIIFKFPLIFRRIQIFNFLGLQELNCHTLYIFSVRSSKAASLRRFGVRFADMTTALPTVLLDGGSNMEKQYPASTKMAASIQRHSFEQGLVRQ